MAPLSSVVHKVRVLWVVTIGLSLTGLASAVTGVRLLDRRPDHQVGNALLEVGAATIGGAIVAGVLGWVQQRIDDERSEKELERAQNLSLDLLLISEDNLQNIDLSEQKLIGFHLADRDFTNGTFGLSDLSGSILSRCIFAGSDLTDADLTGTRLEDADFTGAVLTGTDLTGAVLVGAVFSGADLTSAVLHGADVRGADLSGATIHPGLKAITAHDIATTRWPPGYL